MSSREGGQEEAQTNRRVTSATSSDWHHHFRRPVHFQLRLAYHAYLIFAGAGICVWTQISLWHGHEIVWVFGVVLAMAGNLVSQACRYAIRTDRDIKKGPHEKHKARPVEIALIVAGFVLAIISIVQSFR